MIYLQLQCPMIENLHVNVINFNWLWSSIKTPEHTRPTMNANAQNQTRPSQQRGRLETASSHCNISCLPASFKLWNLIHEPDTQYTYTSVSTSGLRPSSDPSVLTLRNAYLASFLANCAFRIGFHCIRPRCLRCRSRLRSL